MIKKGVHFLMGFVFVVTSLLFFFGVFKGVINIKYLALYLGWLAYWGVYLLLVFIDKKHEEKVMEEVKEKQ